MGSINRDKKKALVFISLGVVISFFSYQNFKAYPETIAKTNLDMTATLNQSESELRRFRSHMANQRAHQAESPVTKSEPARPAATAVVEAPMKLKLKRAPAKTSAPVKKSKKKKKKTKSKSRSKPKTNSNTD